MIGAVSDFLESMDHPRKAEILALVDFLEEQQFVTIVKWNSPTICLGELDFLTIRWQPKAAFQLIFHCGTKLKMNMTNKGISSNSLPVKWLDDARLMVELKEQSNISESLVEIGRMAKDWSSQLSVD